MMKVGSQLISASIVTWPSLQSGSPPQAEKAPAWGTVATAFHGSSAA